jgi:hypothetical protein
MISNRAVIASKHIILSLVTTTALVISLLITANSLTIMIMLYLYCGISGQESRCKKALIT